MRPLLLILLFFISWQFLNGQQKPVTEKKDTLPEKFYVLQNVDRNGETMPEIAIKEVTIAGRPKRSSGSQFRQYERLVYNVKRVYPYSLIVRYKVEEVNSVLETIPGEKERKDYMKEVEKSVFSDYEDDMRRMTITQGKILIKLIDRETKNTSFSLIRDYKGWMSAVFWQGIARIFGTNLKSEYDPYGEDAMIERIIQEIEAGRL